MMILGKGYERTEQQFNDLFKKGNLKVADIKKTASTLAEAFPA